jgi:alpha-tubulin suppressor-like RCC1 family protein
LTDIVTASAGTDPFGVSHSLAVTKDGAVWAWGANGHGQLGNDTTTPSPFPVQVLDLTDVVSVAAGSHHSLALKKDGTIWAWGSNDSGQLGVATPSIRKKPQQVAGISGVAQIGAGLQSSYALRTDGSATGTVWSWGANSKGELGDGTLLSKTSPVSGISGVVSLSAGVYFADVLRSDDSVWAWGDNFYGQLADGTPQTNRSQPVAVQVPSGSYQLDCGYFHCLGVRDDGVLWGWGLNSQGILGTDVASFSLGTPIAGIGNVAMATTNHQLSIALKRDGTLWTWGLAYLGDDTTAQRSTPGQLTLRLVEKTGFEDADGDGLSDAAEYELGTDPLNADTNGDGLLDGSAVASGVSATNQDMDGDGVANSLEVQRGTDAFRTDTDGDAVGDGTDCFPLDPTRWQCPPPQPGDTTAPVITLSQPTNATLVNVVPPIP